MPKIVDLKQRSPGWHAWRTNKISASMIPTIMGFNPHQTPLQLYEELTGDKKRAVNEAMQRGIDLEPKARAWSEAFLDCKYPEACLEHKDFPHFIASMDGYNPNGKVKAIEIKCPGTIDLQKARLGVVPPQYYPQLQWQMFVADIDCIFYISFDGVEGEIIKVQRDDRFLTEAQEAAHDFYWRLHSFTPPEPCDRDLIEINDPEAEKWASELKQIEDTLTTLEKAKELLRGKLINRCEGKSSRIGDCRIVKYQRKGNVDYKKIPELEGVDLELYRKSATEVWRVS